QHDAGKLTVRERIDALVDPGTFHEVGALTGRAEYDEGQLAGFTPANFVMGRARIEGRPVVVGGDDFTVRGGAADASIFQKQVHAEQMANELRLPIVRLVDGSGGGGSVKSIETMARSFVPFNPGWEWVVENLATVPVVALCLGSVAGLGAARVVTSHYSVMVRGTSHPFVAGSPASTAGRWRCWPETRTPTAPGGRPTRRRRSRASSTSPTPSTSPWCISSTIPGSSSASTPNGRRRSGMAPGPLQRSTRRGCRGAR